MEFCKERVSDLFREGEECLSFYLNKPNRKGWGVVYLRLRVGADLLRLSTGVKVRADYWSKEEGRIILPPYLSDINSTVHERADDILRKVKEFVFSKDFYIFAMLAGQSQIEINASIREAIIKFLKRANMVNNKKNILISSLLYKEVEKIANEKTRKNVEGILSNFKKFLKSEGLADSVEVINQKTMRRYLAWLKDSANGIGIARGKNCLNYIFKLLRDIEESNELEFEIDSKIAKNYKESRSMSERVQNCFALSNEEVEKLKDLELEGRLATVRDIFLLQCYCGCRFEDLGLLLDSKNLREIDDVKYSVFTTQKKGITSQTPLNHPSYFPEALALYERYVDRPPFNDKQHNTYNSALKKIAKMAGLDREIIHTSTKGTAKTKRNVKLYEKISSHVGRHTFITNCKRYKKIDPNHVALITGHSDIRLIESIYCNLQEEDKINMVHNAGEVSVRAESNPIPSNNIVNGEREAKSVLTYLGVDFDDSLDFEGLVRLIEQRQYSINDRYGVPITLLKDIYNLHLPISKRVKALNAVLDGLTETM